jgi:sugar lactone lactonase YvrE
MPDVEVVVHRPAELAESPVWDEDRQCLWWVDITEGMLHRFDPEKRRDESESVGAELGAVALRQDGGLVAAAAMGFAMVGDSALQWLGKVESGRRMNDGKCDPGGRFLAGTLIDESTPGQAAFYRLERGSVSKLFGGVTISNGLDWSPSGELMYYVDTPLQRIDVFDYDVATGTPSNRRTFVDLREVPGRPDGLTVDADGAVWVAMARGGAAIRRFLPDGRPNRMVAMQVPNVTSLAFGGPDLDQLYVTSSRHGLGERVQAAYPLAGCVFRVRGLGVRGRTSYRYIP